MDFTLTDEQRSIRDTIARICDGFGDAYWFQKDRDHEFPHEFAKEFAEGFAKGFHVERYFRASILPLVAPVSQERALCYVAERALGLPKSY